MPEKKHRRTERFGRLAAAATAALFLATRPGPIEAGLIDLNGSLGGLAQAGGGDVSSTKPPTLVTGFGPTTFATKSPAGGEGDEETVIEQSLNAAPSGLTLTGSTVSSDNGSDLATDGLIDSKLAFGVDAAGLYQLTFTKNTDPSGSAFASLRASDASIADLVIDLTDQPGAQTVIETVRLGPGPRYILDVVLTSAAGGEDGTSESPSLFTLTLAVVPEPAAAVGCLPLLALVWRRRRHRGA